MNELDKNKDVLNSLKDCVIFIDKKVAELDERIGNINKSNQRRKNGK